MIETIDLFGSSYPEISSLLAQKQKLFCYKICLTLIPFSIFCFKKTPTAHVTWLCIKTLIKLVHFCEHHIISLKRQHSTEYHELVQACNNSKAERHRDTYHDEPWSVQLSEWMHWELRGLPGVSGREKQTCSCAQPTVGTQDLEGDTQRWELAEVMGSRLSIWLHPNTTPQAINNTSIANSGDLLIPSLLREDVVCSCNKRKTNGYGNDSSDHNNCLRLHQNSNSFFSSLLSKNWHWPTRGNLFAKQSQS